MTEYDLGAAVSTHSGAGARTAWAVVLQRIGRQGSAARHNVKNGAGYGRECEEDEDAEGRCRQRNLLKTMLLRGHPDHTEHVQRLTCS